MHRLTFVGTATTLLELGAFTVLTDPNFIRRGQRAYLGKGLWSRRLTDPALTPEELPRLDAVVLSHLHGDHFDRVARRRLAREQPVLTTPAAARRLGSWGFDAHGLDTWASETLTRDEETLRVESLPGIHGRGVMRGLLPPVMGTLLEHRAADGRTRRVYLSGDTLTGDHLDAIAERYPELDAAVVHLGGTRVLLHTVTMDAVQGVDFLRRIRPRVTVPVHHDDYRVFRSPLSDFEALAAREGVAEGLRTVARGASVSLDPGDPDHGEGWRSGSGAPSGP
ncbi:MBL fold metallo-hydrolase [Nocardioides caldifontis]|uniref:MBL fold metallo-hydrolase n=1 Tax=Nocardioides caldifontis TaxID=2588938 RepID=UPI0011DFB732|nr:MBL fold metallo-hydrolase [Nocardioides caldifontis]